MKRGEVWTLRGQRFASKSRPVVIIGTEQPQFNTVITCLLTSTLRDDAGTRPKIEPSAKNGLRTVSAVMTDKIASVKPDELGTCIGTFTDEEISEIAKGLAILLGITATDLV